VASAFTSAATDSFLVDQTVEGLNAAHLNWGSANAKTVTLSGIINASVTGSYAVAIRNGSSARSYVSLVTVSAANTDTPFSVAIPGDTAGTWPTDNTLWGSVGVDLGSGSNFNAASANTWSAGNFFRTSGSVSPVATLGATVYFKDVQLEAGSVATPFERRSIGAETIMCQRYYQRYTAAGANVIFFSGYGVAASSVNWQWFLSPSMRAAPTGSIIGSWGTNNTGAPVIAATSPIGVGLSATAGSTGFVAMGNPANGGFDLSAEL
jgi:hypothetical protein